MNKPKKCGCGCGIEISIHRDFIDKEHYQNWRRLPGNHPKTQQRIHQIKSGHGRANPFTDTAYTVNPAHKKYNGQ